MKTLKMGCVAAACLLAGSLAASAGEAPAVAGVQEVPFVEGKPAPDPRAGGVWCLVTKPAEYKTVAEQVVIRPGTHYLEAIPAVFEAREERIMVEPERKREVFVPAKFKTEQVQELIQPESTGTRFVPAQYADVEKLVVVTPERSEEVLVPAVYDTVQEKIEIEPARREARQVDCNTQGVNIIRGESKDLCYTHVEIPARYQTITKRVLKQEAKVTKRMIPAVTRTIRTREEIKPATTETYAIPAQYATVTKTVETSPAHYTFETIPARYETIRKMVEVKPENTRKVDVPAQYKTLTNQTMTKPAEMVWRLCADDARPSSSVVEKYGSLPGITDRAGR